MSRSRPAAVAVAGATALAALVAATGAASAQEVTPVTVSALAETGARQFFVEDLTGTALSNLSLGSTGEGQLFQVRVKDTGFLSPSAPFTASAEMTHLYRQGESGPDYSNPVPSSKIQVSYVGAPDVSGVSFGAIPRLSLTGTLPSCGQLPNLLPVGSPLLDPAGGTGILDPLLDPLSALVDSLGLTDAAKPLCTALGGDTTTRKAVDDLDAVLITLQEQVLQAAAGATTGLPLDTVSESNRAGAFDNPSWLGEVASADPSKTTTTSTKRVMLRGKPAAAADLGLLGQVSPLVDGKPLFGTGGVTDVASVVGALKASVDPVVASVGTALSGLAAADQTGVLGTVANTSGVVATLLDPVLSKISGTYRSFPRLQADLAGAVAGNYSGRMTVTFLQE
jgi:hypothetical protein